jgi:hypothetical protein
MGRERALPAGDPLQQGGGREFLRCYTAQEAAAPGPLDSGRSQLRLARPLEGVNRGFCCGRTGRQGR